MRLEKNEIEIVKKSIEAIFGKSKIYLFGSRLDNSKKGGDIDLFIVPENRDTLYEKKIKAIAKLERYLYKPIDIVVHKDFKREIEQEGLSGVLL